MHLTFHAQFPRDIEDSLFTGATPFHNQITSSFTEPVVSIPKVELKGRDQNCPSTAVLRHDK